jgi:hypothetical protein
MYLSGTPVAEIARDCGCSDGPIYRILIDAGVPVSKRAAIDSTNLGQWYLEEHLSIAEISRRLNVCPATVRRHLLLNGIPLRTHAESLQPVGRKPCPRSLTYRAYALGFVWGDMAAERLWATSHTIAVRGSTTKQEQLAVIENLFADFGKVTVTPGTKSMCVRASLDLSFEFLLEKYNKVVPKWVTGVPVEAAFAAGYIDAEGSFGIYEHRARFKLDSYDEVIHEWLSAWLGRCGISHKTWLVSRRGDPRQNGQYYNGDLWRTNVNDGLSICRLSATIEPFARHERRRETMAAAVDNVRNRLRSRDPTLQI